MNHYESKLYDKLLEMNNKRHDFITAHGFIEDEQHEMIGHILTLLDLGCDFREPPRALDVADGYGVLATVDERGEVVA